MCGMTSRLQVISRKLQQQQQQQRLCTAMKFHSILCLTPIIIPTTSATTTSTRTTITASFISTSTSTSRSIRTRNYNIIPIQHPKQQQYQHQHHHQQQQHHRFYSTSNDNNNNDDNHDVDTLDGNKVNVDSNDEEFATTYHAPVMWKECIDALLDCQRSKLRQEDSSILENNDEPEQQQQQQGENHNHYPLIFVDGTLGGGGHSAALLQQLKPGDVLFGCDVDPNALRESSKRLSKYMDGQNTAKLPLFIPIRSNFCDIATVIPQTIHPITNERIIKEGGGVDGILLDLGVSSHQIDTPERGFAFMKDGPLDMRMNSNNNSINNDNDNDNHSNNHDGSLQFSEKKDTTISSGITAADICNEFDQRELQRIFSVYGDEPRSKVIAKSIIDHRPLSTTSELVNAISAVTPKFAKNKRKGLTATCARIFQSLRIVVNNEDDVLEAVLSEACPDLIRPGGRLVVLSYHSMEDRAAKRIMRDGTVTKKVYEEKDMYGNYIGPPKPFRPVGKRRKATENEIEINPRARSAVLRIAERQ